MKLYFKRALWCLKVTGWIIRNRAVYVFVSVLPKPVTGRLDEWITRNYAKQIGQRLLLKKELKTLGDF